MVESTNNKKKVLLQSTFLRPENATKGEAYKKLLSSD